MVPKNSGNKTVLVCRRCGYEVAKFKAYKYKIVENIRHKHGDILVVEGKSKRDIEEQRRYIVDLYGKETHEESEE
jgi:DNA-directed RNA polymerase subunit M/transcription elongation factor TFIIS